jgi:hypothetical protein
MNQALAIRIAIIAGGVIGGAGLGFGGYKGVRALQRRRAAKKAIKKMDATLSTVGNAAEAAADAVMKAA